MGNHICYVNSGGLEMIDTTGWSEMKKLKHRMLKRAFDENRGPQMILLMQWRAALTKHMAQKDVQTLQAFEEQNAGQPRALRALNLIEGLNGSNVVHKLTEEKPKISIFELLANQPKETRIEMKKLPFNLATAPAFNADHYDPMEGLQITTGYALACRAYAALDMPKDSGPQLKN